MAQLLFALACLPYEASFSLDAIVRTSWRTPVTHRRLLEWSPSGDSGSGNRGSRQGGPAGACRTMWFAPGLAAAAAIHLWHAHPAGLAAAAPLLLLWFASPVIAWQISRPLAPDNVELTPDQTAFLHTCARKTWSFFETFVGPGDNWLPPDNYQDHPAPAVAHRTSPTNMGLYLLGTTVAHDFGTIGKPSPSRPATPCSLPVRKAASSYSSSRRPDNYNYR